MLPETFRTYPCLVIGHRGSPRRAPENTLSSFRKAFEEGAQGVECDVRLSRDHQPMIFHDENLYRLTGHRRMKIERLNSAGIKTIQFGKRLGFSDRYEIPSLEELFRNFAGKGCFYLELKAESLSRNEKRILARRTMAAVARFGLMKSSIIVSFDYSLVKWVKQRDSRYLTGLNFTHLRDLAEPRKDRFRFLDCLCPSLSSLSDRLMTEAKVHDLDVLVWVVNTARDLRRALALARISHHISTATANSASSASSICRSAPEAHQPSAEAPTQRTVKHASYGLGRLPRIQSGLGGLATKSDEKCGLGVRGVVTDDPTTCRRALAQRFAQRPKRPLRQVVG